MLFPCALIICTSFTDGLKALQLVIVRTSNDSMFASSVMQPGYSVQDESECSVI